MKDFDTKLVGTHADPMMPHTVYGIGFKGVNKDEIAEKAGTFIKKFAEAVKPKKKMSYEFSLYLKGVFRGKKYIEDVRKRHMVTFDFI